MTEERKERIKENIFLPLREWLRGNPQVDNNMQIELLGIFNDAIKRTINECYGKMKETMEKRNNES